MLSGPGGGARANAISGAVVTAPCNACCSTRCSVRGTLTGLRTLYTSSLKVTTSSAPLPTDLRPRPHAPMWCGLPQYLQHPPPPNPSDCGRLSTPSSTFNRKSYPSERFGALTKHSPKSLVRSVNAH